MRRPGEQGAVPTPRGRTRLAESRRRWKKRMARRRRCASLAGPATRHDESALAGERSTAAAMLCLCGGGEGHGFLPGSGADCRRD